MSRRTKMTEEERIAAVQEYLDGKGSYTGISKKIWSPYRIIQTNGKERKS